MAGFVAKKPCRFAGVGYLTGDNIPSSAIPANDVAIMVRMGFIKEESKTANKADKSKKASTNTNKAKKDAPSEPQKV